MLGSKKEIKQVCMNEIKTMWLESSDSFPCFLPDIPIAIRRKNASYIKKVSKKIKKMRKNFPYIEKKRKKWKDKMFTLIEDVLHKETVIGIHKIVSIERMDTFQNELKEFFVLAREFAPTLSIEEIGQALRNYIVYTMFVEINQVKPGLNRACFAYSMLYPFTDNYIDSNEHSKEEKKEYNEIIRKRIKGEKVDPQSLHQKKTCELLSIIESEYPCEKESSVCIILLIMLEAQEDSLKQNKKDCYLSYEERLDISIYKGGVSVLIDRFFVNKEIKKEDLNFYLGFGFFLQLVDDLQDIAEDRESGHQTIFTIDISLTKTEKIVNKMFFFLHQIMKDYKMENDIFKKFYFQSCYEFICLAIVGSKEFFSPEYLKKIEKYMLVTMVSMEKKKIVNKKKNIPYNYYGILDEMICR